MIDDETEVRALIGALNKLLPMKAYASPQMVKALRRQGTSINVKDALKIDSVLYLGDEGGSACSVGLSGGKNVVVTSITHLRFDGNHPLAGQIQRYQSRRSQRIAGQ